MKRSLFQGASRGLLHAFGSVTVISSRSNYRGGCRRFASVWSFGDNSNGALGISSPLLDAYEPTKVLLLPATVTKVAAGHYHSLAVNADGDVWAWGRNEEGQLGRGFYAPRSFLSPIFFRFNQPLCFNQFSFILSNHFRAKYFSVGM